MAILEGLEPKKVFEFFEYISSVPRGSGNTGAVSELCIKFAKDRGLTCYKDGLNNVIIYKNATPGYENAPTIVLQGHLDMVCAKNVDCSKDMDKEPIDLMHDDKYVFAKDTTLGGDDGIAIAYALAVLDSDEIKHPNIEAVFTVDEEVGMDGARDINPKLISGRKFLNIDSEEEGIFTCGCAGGCRLNGLIPVEREKFPLDRTCLSITLSGLCGGHSGTEINKQPASSNYLMGRVLFELNEKFPINLISLEGGKFDNVITPATSAGIAVNEKNVAEITQFIEKYSEVLKLEYGSINPDIKLSASVEEKIDKDNLSVLDKKSTFNVLSAIYLSFQGVIEMDMDLKGLVQTSQNLGVLCLKENEFNITFLVRSSIDSQKDHAIKKITSLIKLFGGTVSLLGNYPGWKYVRESKFRDLCVKKYNELYGKDPVITSIHAGLECGLFAEKLEGLDAISIGPNILDIHTPMERLEISSVERTWKLILRVLESANEL
ncbi:MAG: aminoacyl-histidine dipeptidase [Lachnospiraceae bacterium]|nr:aminoacyl-histidine dipeptidase [Lachnospiraceae bacterium]